MASKSDSLELEAVRHFKAGQLSAWVGDEKDASREFLKCVKAVEHLQREGRVHELKELAKLAERTPRKRVEQADVHERTLPAEQSRRVRITYTLVAQGSNKAEFRARVHLPWKYLSRLARKTSGLELEQHLFADRAWQWIEVNEEKGFTASFLLTYADGTVHGQITSHYFLDQSKLNNLREDIAELIINRIIGTTFGS